MSDQFTNIVDECRPFFDCEMVTASPFIRFFARSCGRKEILEKDGWRLTAYKFSGKYYVDNIEPCTLKSVI